MNLKNYLQLISVMAATLTGWTLTSCSADQTEFSSGRQAERKTAVEKADQRRAQSDAMGVMTLTFKAGYIDETTIEIDPGLGLVEQDLVMHQKPLTEIAYNQVERTLTPLKFTQGHDGDIVTDEFEVVEAGKVDILIVVDDSQTMEPIQDLLATSLPELLTHIQDLNWHIAINTTTTPCLRQTQSGVRILSKADYDQDQAQTLANYEELIQVGNQGNNLERGIRSAGLGMMGSCPKGDYSWRRDDAKPVVLVVSDEKNCGSSSVEGCPGADYETGDFLTSRVPDVRVYGLLLLTEYAPQCPDLGGYPDFYPSNYIDLINETGGIYDSICQKNYRNVMKNISQDVSEQVVKKFLLSYPPDDAPQLELDGVPIDNAYILNGKVLRMTEDLPITAKSLKISYHHGAVRRSKVYPLKGKPDPRSLYIRVNGNEITEDGYVFKKNPPSLELKNMPPDKASIEVSFREDDPLPDTFAFDDRALIETLRIEVDGEEIKDFEVDSAKKKVRFAKPPMDGKKVAILFEQEGDRTTTYPITATLPERIDQIFVEDPRTGETIEFTYDDKAITFGNKDVAGERRLQVRYKVHHTPEELHYEVPLLFEPLDGSMEIITEGDEDACPVPAMPGNQTLQIQCLDDEFTSLKVKYEHAIDYTHEFAIGDRPTSRIIVHIDGQPTSEFEVADGFISFAPATLPIGSEVTVIIAPQ